MPHLVAPLVTGFPAAAGGTAEFFSLGTAERSTLVFADPNGITPVTTTTLGADGEAERYISEACTVVVKNSQGAQVRTWSESTDARLVRVENSLFTGPNTNGNGQTVVGGRTTLHAGLTLFAASFGSADGYVIGDDSTTYLVQAAAKFSARQNRTVSTDLNGTSYTPNANYHTHMVNHLTGASIAFANTSPSYGFYGAELIIVYINNTGGNRTPTWGTAYSGAPATAVATTTVAVYVYKKAPVNTGQEWVLVTTSPVTSAS
jgi:hypothetical protein